MADVTHGGETSAASKRAHMLTSALGVFVANGYVGTSTNQLAAAAAVSKQTLYKAFGDKEGVFTALIRAECERIHNPFALLLPKMAEAATAEESVRLLAEQFTGSILDPRIQQLRRLVIAEAARFPALGMLYWESGFAPMLTALGRCFAVLDERGLLAVSDPMAAANHFAGMLLWIPGNHAMFAGPTRPVSDEELARSIETGIQAFLRAYQRADRPRRA